MIVFGSKMYFKRNVVKSFGDCAFCGSYCNQISYQARKFGHFYWIPLIPMGGKSQVLNECSACEMGAMIPVSELEPRVESLKDQFKSWISDVQEGKTEIMPEGATEPVNCGVLIAGILEDLYCLNEIEDVSSISEILTANNLQFENQIMLGKWNELHGDLTAASESYQAAHRTRPDDAVALYQWASAEVKQGNGPAAEEAFAKYQELDPEDVSGLIMLASLYETQKDFAKIVTFYDKLYEKNPEFISDKGMKKIYKKACKKSGTAGKFLAQM